MGGAKRAHVMPLEWLAPQRLLRNRARIIVHFRCELTHLVVVAEIHPSKRINQ
jgi:hypothetical protein